MALDFGLSGKTAAVTGGANGIGFAIARLLREAGARVWIFDREASTGEQSAQEIEAHFVQTDVTSRSSIDAAFAQLGTPDVVVANAGIAIESELLSETPSGWDRILTTNLTGAFHTVQAAALAMKARGGAIVLTASTNSYDGEGRLAAYNSSKAGLLGLVHTAANELGPYAIRVNAVCPGLIRTRLTERHFTDPGILRDYFRHIPLGRGGEAAEVAAGCVFLASSLASYITGATLFIDGGQMAAKFGMWNEENAEFADGRWKLRGNQS